MYLESESKREKTNKKWKRKKPQHKPSQEQKKSDKESRYTSAGVGIFSLGLVTTFALLFICGLQKIETEMP